MSAQTKRKVEEVRDEEDYPAARTNGSRRHPAAHFVRLTNAENARLHRIVDPRGWTVTRFLRDAITAALDAAEQEEVGETPKPVVGGYNIQIPESMRNPQPSPYMASFANPFVSPPLAPPAPTPPSAPAPQIVISTTTGTVGAPGGSAIDMLAQFVVTGERFKRDGRLRQVVEILKATGKDDAEKMALGKALEEKIAALDGAPKAPKSVMDFLGDFFKL